MLRSGLFFVAALALVTDGPMFAADPGPFKRLRTVREQRTHDLAFAPDNSFAVYGLDHEIKSVKLTDRPQKGPLNIPVVQNIVQSLAIDPKGKTLVVGTYASGELQFWDIATVKLQSTILNRKPGGMGDGGHRFESLNFSPDGRMLASANNMIPRQGCYTVVIDPAARQVKHSFRTNPEGKVVLMSEFSPDGKLLASLSIEGHVHVWDVAKNYEQRITVPNSGRDCTLCFAPTGKVIAVSDNKGNVGLWDFAKAKPELTTTIEKAGGEAMIYLPGGLLVSGRGREVQIWDTQTKKVVATYRDNADPIKFFRINRSGTVLASVSGGDIVFFEINGQYKSPSTSKSP